MSALLRCRRIVGHHWGTGVFNCGRFSASKSWGRLLCRLPYMQEYVISAATVLLDTLLICSARVVDFCSLYGVLWYFLCISLDFSYLFMENNTPCPEKRGHVIFDYNSRISSSIFIIFSPLETGMNTPQSHVIYLLKILMTS